MSLAADGIDETTVTSSGNTPSGDDPNLGDDEFVTIFFTNSTVFGTGIDYELIFTTASNEWEDLAGNDTANDSTITEVDAAGAVLTSVYAVDYGTAGIFNTAGDRMDLIFSETLDSLPTLDQLDTALTFSSLMTLKTPRKLIVKFSGPRQRSGSSVMRSTPSTMLISRFKSFT